MMKSPKKSTTEAINIIVTSEKNFPKTMEVTRTGAVNNS